MASVKLSERKQGLLKAATHYSHHSPLPGRCGALEEDAAEEDPSPGPFFHLDLLNFPTGEARSPSLVSSHGLTRGSYFYL